MNEHFPLDSLSKYNQNFENLGLNSHKIAQDFAIIQQLTKNSSKSTEQKSYKIIDTCRLDNKKILKINDLNKEKLNNIDLKTEHIASFIPAAGASSRYLKPLTELLSVVKEKNKEATLQKVDELNKYLRILPNNLADFIKNFDVETSAIPKQIEKLFTSPKALFPSGVDDFSFLELKVKENNFYDCFSRQIFICPPSYAHKFKKKIEQVQEKNPLDSQVIEQGPKLSTVRFKSNGDLFVDQSGNPSLVPAGHGALASLFPQIKNNTPEVQSFFIRNIDNNIGLSRLAKNIVQDFLKLHTILIQLCKSIRNDLGNKNYASAERRAQVFCQDHGISLPQKAVQYSYPYLLTVQLKLFNFPHNPNSNHTFVIEDVFAAYSKPVTTLGQVPNNGVDVGGSPVIIEDELGRQLGVCLERPHASKEDIEFFLANPKRATHFNPVFVACEACDHYDFINKDHGFWILAKKQWLGQDVLYLETVLYELIGNSLFTNCTFIELPRTIFNPHKSLEDTLKSSVIE